MTTLREELLKAASEHQPHSTNRTLIDEVMFNLDAIDEARRQGLSYEKIAEIFTTKGHQISARTLQEYHRKCHANLSQTKKRSRPRKKSKKNTHIETLPNLKSSEPDYSSMRAPDPIYPVKAEVVS